MFISLMLGYFGSFTYGSGSCAFSFVKTDLNWSFSSSAFLFQRAKQIERTEDWDKYRLQKRAMQKAVRQAHWSYVNNVLESALEEVAVPVHFLL
jgi:hypothetical protein